MRAFLQRRYHFFISYSHKDATFAESLNDWLSKKAGLITWLDQSDLPSGARVQANIATGISDCQGIIFVLSRNSLASKWVPDELDQAFAEKKENPWFQIVLLRLDDGDIAGQWKVIRQLKWHELAGPSGPRLNLQAAAEILRRIHAYDGWQGRQDAFKEVYVSRGWRPGEEVWADEICRRLAVHGLRLVGDLPDQGPTDLQRIAGIMRGCWGHLLALPRRHPGKGPEVTYKHFQQEFELSRSLGLPRVVVAEPESPLPPALGEEAFVVSSEMLAGQDSAGAGLLQSRVYDFAESLVRPQVEVHAFFSSEFEGNEERNSLARAVVEVTGTLPCYWGKDYRDMNVPGAIKDAIASAKFVVADLTSPEDSSGSRAGEPRSNVNACIEAGIAWGANVRVLLLAAENPLASQAPLEGKTKHVPFMFRYAQLELYGDSVSSLAPGVEFLGAVHKAVLEDRKKYGRRVINYELGL